jgi:hypothetical protein
MKQGYQGDSKATRGITMVAGALSQTSRSFASVGEFHPWKALLASWVAMSKRDDIEMLWAREDLSFREKFEAYLDGYTMTFDMYPVCQRQLFMRNDAYALMRDFMAVGEDMNRAAQKLLSAANEEFSNTGMGPDEIRRRRIEAAKRTLAAIERTRDQIRRDVGGSPQKADRRSHETSE